MDKKFLLGLKERNRTQERNIRCMGGSTAHDYTDFVKLSEPPKKHWRLPEHGLSERGRALRAEYVWRSSSSLSGEQGEKDRQVVAWWNSLDWQTGRKSGKTEFVFFFAERIYSAFFSDLTGIMAMTLPFTSSTCTFTLPITSSTLSWFMM